METESNILRSPALIRQTIGTLRDQGEYSPSPGILNKWVSEPLKRYVTTPLREYIVNPLRDGLGLEVDPVRDTTLDMLTDEAIANLKIETQIGRAHVCTPVTNAHLVCRLLLEKKKNKKI